MFSLRSIAVAICAFLLSFYCQNAFADSSQVKVELPDAAALGMGAFTGEADRPSAVYYNPAGIVQMNSPEVSADLTWIQPQMKFESTSGVPSEMKEDNYLFPSFFATTPIIKDKLYLGIGESTDFAGGNDWEGNGYSRYNTIKDSLTDMDYRIALAYKVNDQWSFGFAPVIDYSNIEHDVAIYQLGAPPGDGNALFKANDTSFGFDLAAMFKLNAQNQFGLTYKSPISHKYDGRLYLSNLAPLGLGSSGYFNASSANIDATEKLTLPQSVTLGYDFKPTNKWTFNFDLEWTDWAQVRQQIIDYPGVTAAEATALSSGAVQARNWRSVWSEAIGAQYAVTDRFRVRTGFQHHQSFVPQSNFDTDYPDLTSNGVSAGFGYDITSRLTVDVAYAGAFEDTRKVTSTIGVVSVGQNNLSGKYSGFVNIGLLTLTYKF